MKHERRRTGEKLAERKRKSSISYRKEKRDSGRLKESFSRYLEERCENGFESLCSDVRSAMAETYRRYGVYGIPESNEELDDGILAIEKVYRYLFAFFDPSRSPKGNGNSVNGEDRDVADYEKRYEISREEGFEEEANEALASYMVPVLISMFGEDGGLQSLPGLPSLPDRGLSNVGIPNGDMLRRRGFRLSQRNLKSFFGRGLEASLEILSVPYGKSLACVVCRLFDWERIAEIAREKLENWKNSYKVVSFRVVN